jgi:hypothetical protein
MTRDDLMAYADRVTAESPAHGIGMHAVLAGAFDESRCAPQGHVDESSYCEGARDALQLLDESEPVGRIAHGQSVGGPG